MHYRGFMAAALALALSGLAASSALADDTIPPEAKALLEPLPLSPRGQPVPGFPDGPPAVSPDVLKFSDQDLAKLKAGKFTAGLVMHTMTSRHTFRCRHCVSRSSTFSVPSRRSPRKMLPPRW